MPEHDTPPADAAGFEPPRTAIRQTFTRRRLLTTAGTTGTAGLVLGGSGAALLTAKSASPAPTAADLAAATGNQRLPYYGRHQPGIIAPLQAWSRLVAFDLLPGANVQRVATLLRAWAAIAAATMAARALPDDDATATGRGPAGLTVTTGFGAGLLTKLTLADRIPAALAPLPTFPDDRLDPADSDGDLSLLVAANDALVLAHAHRALIRAAAGTATVRWQISGFSDHPGALPTPTATPRNLMGQLDGTDNPTPDQPAFTDQIFVDAHGDPAWLRQGSYLVVRRIRMLLDDWDTLSRTQQENVIGRRKDTGAPLSGGTEHTTPDYYAQRADGGLAIAADAHIRLANPTANTGATILRRGFSYDRGTRPDGAPDAGLLFLAYQADPRTGFIPIQQHLSGADGLNDFIVHETSALFAVPGGVAEGGYPGQALFES